MNHDDGRRTTDDGRRITDDGRREKSRRTRRDYPMKAVYALYPDPHAAQRAVDGLRAAGVDGREIAVISSEPFEEQEFSHRDKATWMPWIAGLGGWLGLAFGYWLTRMTETSWPLPTGGMPIVSTWPNLIIMFELTMLGGILATVITLLVTARLPGRRPSLYDPAVADGEILVGVENLPDADCEKVERALGTGGTGRVKTLL